jgi:hypothetical protein
MVQLNKFTTASLLEQEIKYSFNKEMLTEFKNKSAELNLEQREREHFLELEKSQNKKKKNKKSKNDDETKKIYINFQDILEVRKLLNII